MYALVTILVVTTCYTMLVPAHEVDGGAIIASAWIVSVVGIFICMMEKLFRKLFRRKS